MPTSTFPTVTTGVTVQTATNGALSGDGSSGNKLAVGVDGVSTSVNGSDQLQAIGIAGSGGTTVPVSGTLPNIDGASYTPTLAGAGAGSLSNGVYRYKFTAATPYGETAPGTATSAVTVVDHTADGQVSVNVPIFYTSGVVTALNIYRTKAGGSSYFLIATRNITGAGFNDDGNTGTGLPYVDNIADAAQGAAAPSTNTTAGSMVGFAQGGIFGAYRGVLGEAGDSYMVSLTNPATPSADVTLYTQDAIGEAGEVGAIILDTGAGFDGHSGDIDIRTGPTWGAGITGNVNIFPGEAHGSASAGHIRMFGGGADGAGDGGGITVGGGSSAGGAAGSVKIVDPNNAGISRLLVDGSGNVFLNKVAFASLPSSAVNGSLATITDCTVTSGTISGGGGLHVNVAVYNGTNWLVFINLT